MAGASKSVQKYLRSVNQANAALSQRWSAISNHLKFGLAQPVGNSEFLFKAYAPPSEFIGQDGKKHRKPVRALYGFGQSAREKFDADMASHERQSAELKARVEADNLAVTYWRGRAQTGDEEAVRWYCQTVLPSVLPRPPGGDGYLASGYSASERHLVIERYVPGIEVVPDVHRYEVARNLHLHPAGVTQHDRGSWYLSFLAQAALLSVDRIYRSEIAPVIEKATVNCLTVLRNPATGHLGAICVLSVSVPRQHFATLNLLGVDPATCVLSLGGRMTGSPGSYAPVTPWAEAKATGDLVVAVTDTPLLQMDPAVFEQLVTELMRRMGLRAESTGRSGDGGVDCIAYDDRPVVGGKVIVQVKRYANTVSPSVVRDLFGTVHATGATKGVLITTSGFGPESRQFVQGKPLELVDGIELDALLQQYELAGVMSQAPLTPSVSELQQDAPPISPDGRYYLDGAAWQVTSDGHEIRVDEISSGPTG